MSSLLVVLELVEAKVEVEVELCALVWGCAVEAEW